MINLYDILEAAEGQLFGDAAASIFTDFCFDSRQVNHGELFVAFRTDRGEANQYMQEAVRGGALGIMCMYPPEFDTNGVTVIVMRDIEKALRNWAKLVLRKFGTSVIAVTGSSGKSTTLEALAAVLGTKFRVYRNTDAPKNRLSVPLSLGKLTSADKLAIVEFGAESIGHMAELVDATQPLVGVITNVYQERADLLQHIANEYQMLVQALPDDGLTVLNYDDDLVRSLSKYSKAQVMTFGLDTTGTAFGADFLAYNLVVTQDKTGFDLLHDRQRYVGRWTPLLGLHQLYDVLAALAVGYAYGVSFEDSLHQLTNLLPLPGRMQRLVAKNNSMLIDDSYNASMDSTLAALRWLGQIKQDGAVVGKTYFILGDVTESSSQGITNHRQLGREIAQVADVLVTQGQLAAEAARTAIDYGLPRSQVKMTFSNHDAMSAVTYHLNPEDVVLITGGASMRMESVSRQLLLDTADSQRLPRPEGLYDNVVQTVLPPRPAWIEIDKNALANNVQQFKSLIGPQVNLMAIVKANAYGHGAVTVATTALLHGANYLGVAILSEGIELREAGIDAPILVLGYTPPWLVQDAIRYNLTLTLYDLGTARAYNNLAHQVNAHVNVHIKIDSGLSRLGMLPSDAPNFFRNLYSLKNIQVEGIFTHFSVADTDATYTHKQIRTFGETVKMLQASGIQFKYIHACNTAGTLAFPEAHFNMVRVGIGLYGLDPDPVLPLPKQFRPVLTWKATIASVKTLAAGTYIGYGNTYQTPREERVAVIPVGYADGFRRAPYHWGRVLVHGHFAPLVGRVSMDMAVVNVSDITDVKIGDEVVLIGRQEDQRITAQDVANIVGVNVYEVVTCIMPRVPRL